VFQQQDDHVDESRNADLEDIDYADTAHTMAGTRCGLCQCHMVLKPQVILMKRMRNDPLPMLLQLRRQQTWVLAWYFS
jgi:hypothetical protein